MGNPPKRNFSDVDQRLATSSIDELLTWHNQLRQNIQIIADEPERKEAMDLLMDIEKKLVAVTRDQLNSQTKEYKEILTQIKNQQKK